MLQMCIAMYTFNVKLILYSLTGTIIVTNVFSQWMFCDPLEIFLVPLRDRGPSVEKHCSRTCNVVCESLYFIYSRKMFLKNRLFQLRIHQKYFHQRKIFSFSWKHASHDEKQRKYTKSTIQKRMSGESTYSYHFRSTTINLHFKAFPKK